MVTSWSPSNANLMLASCVPRCWVAVTLAAFGGVMPLGHVTYWLRRAAGHTIVGDTVVSSRGPHM